MSIMILAQSRSKTFLIPMGLTPGHLSKAINLFAFNALMSSQGTMVFASLLVSFAIASQAVHLHCQTLTAYFANA